MLFDLDGTLVNTLEDLADSMNEVLRQMGFPPHPLDSYRYFVGDGVVRLASRALPPDCVDEASVELCVHLMRMEYEKRWASKSALYPGVAELLSGLAARDIKLAILSNKPDGLTRKVYEKFLSPWNFQVVEGARAGMPVKPDPAQALLIAIKLKTIPERILYVGDTDTDMKTAVAAGMYPVGALWGFRTKPELLGSGAAVVIERPGELLKFAA